MTPADPILSEPSPDRTRIQRRMAMLERLAEIGMEIAEALGRDACSPAPLTADHPHNAGLVFARVARAVRMTIALEQRLARDLADLDKSAHAVPPRAGACRISPRGPVGQPAPDTDDAGPTERLSYAAYERLTDAEDGDLMGRPFDEVVAAICNALRLSPEWTVRVTTAAEAPGQDLPRRVSRGGSTREVGEGGLGSPSLRTSPEAPLRPLRGHLPQPFGPGEDLKGPPPLSSAAGELSGWGRPTHPTGKPFSFR